MSKKDKKIASFTEDSQTVLSLLPKLEGLLKTYISISKGYRLYRENGGDMIQGLEEHLGLKEQTSDRSEKIKKTEKIENKESEIDTKVKKEKKKDKRVK